MGNQPSVISAHKQKLETESKAQFLANQISEFLRKDLSFLNNQSRSSISHMFLASFAVSSDITDAIKKQIVNHFNDKNTTDKLEAKNVSEYGTMHSHVAFIAKNLTRSIISKALTCISPELDAKPAAFPYSRDVIATMSPAKNNIFTPEQGKAIQKKFSGDLDINTTKEAEIEVLVNTLSKALKDAISTPGFIDAELRRLTHDLNRQAIEAEIQHQQNVQEATAKYSNSNSK